MIEMADQQTEQDLDQKAIALIEKVTALEVVDTATRNLAVAEGRIIVTAIDERKKFFAPMKDAAFKAHREVCKRETDAIAPLDTARKQLSKKVGDWEEEQDRIAEEARRKAEEEQRQREEAARKKKEEAEQKLKDAEDAEAAGDQETPEQLVDEAAQSEAEAEAPPPPPAPVPAAPAKAKGSATRKIYSARVVDEVKLIQAVAAGKAPKKAIAIDQSFLNKYATAMKDDFAVPGCELVVESKTSFRKG